MAQYVILIYENEAEWANPDPQVWQQTMDAHNRFPAQVEELGGKVLGGQALQPTQTSTTIRSDVVTDGPFVETKEALGGFYVVEAPDLDRALEIGKRCPATFGGVEVRPVMVFDEPASGGA